MLTLCCDPKALETAALEHHEAQKTLNDEIKPLITDSLAKNTNTTLIQCP